MSDDTEYTWLVEAPGPYYLSVRKMAHHEFFWSADPHRALRFYTLEQADNIMMALRHLRPDLFGFAKNLRDPKPVQQRILRCR